MKVLHRIAGQPVAAWVEEREYGIPNADDQQLIRFIVSATRIHSWATVRLGETEIRTICAMMPGVFRSPQVAAPPPIPFRHPDMVYVSPPRDFAEKIHIVCDPENDAIPDPNRKFIRPGLWFSASLAGGTLIGCGRTLHIVPSEETGRLGDDLKSKGSQALSSFPSFDDPTVDCLNEHGMIKEPAKKGCFIATACYGSSLVTEVATLREFRDTVLARSAIGRCLTSLYYRSSPFPARLIRSRPLLRSVVRCVVVAPMAGLATAWLRVVNKENADASPDPRRSA